MSEIQSNKPVENKTDRAPESKPVVVKKGMTRRQFVKTAGKTMGSLILADILSSHLPTDVIPTFTKKLWEELESGTIGISPDQLRREVEDKYQIEIVGPGTGLSEIIFNEKRYPTAEWDNPRLKMLFADLAVIPPHFYSPRKSGDKVTKIPFALIDEPLYKLDQPNFDAGCNFCGGENRLVVLNIPYFRQTLIKKLIFPRADIELITHELTHTLTSPDINQYIKDILHPIGIYELPDLREAFAAELNFLTKGEIPAYIPEELQKLSEAERQSLLDRWQKYGGGSGGKVFS